MNNEITITVTVPEMDYIMNALSLLPFREVNGFIAKLINQANSQNATAISKTAAVEEVVGNASTPSQTDSLQKMVDAAVAAQLAAKEVPNG